MSKWAQDAERIAALREHRQSDIERWSTLETHNAGWINRVRMALKFIPRDCVVVEIGAGRAFMREMLPAGCSYIPVDLVAHQPDFLTIDLNTPNWTVPSSHVVVALGTLEYVYDFQGALLKLRSATKRLIFTYCCHVPGADVSSRLRQGWLTDLTQAEVETCLNSLGASIVRKISFQDAPHFKQIMWVTDYVQGVGAVGQ